MTHNMKDAIQIKPYLMNDGWIIYDVSGRKRQT